MPGTFTVHELQSRVRSSNAIRDVRCSSGSLVPESPHRSAAFQGNPLSDSGDFLNQPKSGPIQDISSVAGRSSLSRQFIPVPQASSVQAR